MNFADLVSQKIREKGPLAVGLDPHLELLPPYLLEKWFREKGKTLDALALCVAEFNHLVLRAVADVVGIVKIQMAFYEQLGVPGMVALKSTMNEVRNKGLVCIVDGKRNDIGSTASAYAQGYLSGIHVSPDVDLPPFWDADALTVNPYLGEDALSPFFQEASHCGKGLFVLCRTSNPGAPFVQDAFNPEKVYIMVARMVARLGKNMIGNFGFSSAGIVVGATYPEDLQFLREQFPSLLFLVPGIGFQQGKLEGLRPAFRSDGLGVVVNVSRDVLFAYRDGGDPSGFECEKEIRKKAILYQNKLNDLLR